MTKLFLIIFLSLNCFVLTGFAADKGPALDTSQPIEITSQQLEVLQQQRQSIFTGHVIAKQGDMTLTADKLIVELLEKEDQVDHLKAVGNVKVVQLGRVATADQAIFYQGTEKLVLSGNAVVVEGENRVSGSEIIIYLKENRSVVKSSENGRIQAVIVPPKKVK